ncbi:tubulin domain-containing protein [Helicostylum pulchrum]|nr:tubulin domain-containing protein [Helicostylum pulchrum]
MREILTIQLGSIANHVGTHFWNAQEEYFNYSESNESHTQELNHDVLYRSGETSNGVTTYTPRTLIYDLKGGFGSMQKYNRLFNADDDHQQVTWEQGVNRIDRSISKSQYQHELDRMETENDPNVNLDIVQQLDSSVNNWSDYNRIYYHPRSVNPITTHQMDNEITPFDNYTIGRQSYNENEKEMDIFEDNFRFFVEECDNLQGFQIFTDVDDAFGGFTESLLDNIRDEYLKTPIMTYGLSDSHAEYRTDRHKQKIILNRAFGMTRLAELSSMYIPIYTPTMAATKNSGLSPYLYFDEYSRYHTSAIIAAAIETNSLPYRLKHNSVTMAETISKLNWVRNTSLASLSVSLPLPISEKGYIETVETMIKKTQLRPTISLLDRISTTKKIDTYGESIVTRGLPRNMQGQSEYLQKLYKDFTDENDPLQSRFSLDTSFPLPDSYPRIFTNRVNTDGLICNATYTIDPAKSVPVMTRLESGSILKATVDQQLKNLEKIRFADFYEYAQGECALTREDFLETKEALIGLSDVYTNDDDNMMI